MNKLWPLLILLAAACNVANQPTGVGTAGVSGTRGTMSFTSVPTNRNEGSGSVNLVVTLSEAQTEITTVNYSITGTATGGAACTAGVDYISPSGSLTYSIGSKSAGINIPLCADALFEGNENFTVTLTTSTPSLGIGTLGATTITILDAATPPPISFALSSSGSIIEGEVGSTVIPVDINLNYASVLPVSVQLLTSGSATLGVDYTISATSVTFNPGTTTSTVFVTIIGDTIVELNETIVLSFFNPFNGVIGSQPSHNIQITADEVPNPITATMIGIAAQAESAGTVNMVVQINGSTDHDITLQYGVDFTGAISAPRRATFGPSADYDFPGFTGSTATITLPAFTTGFINIPIRILDDAIYEGNEGAIIRLLGGPEISVSGGGIGELVITDNDTRGDITFVAASQSVTESNTVQNAAIRLVDSVTGVETIAGEDVVVTLGTANGTTNTVVGRTDWSMNLGSVTIPAGASRVSVPFSAVVDFVDEDDESFSITLAPPAGYAAVAGGDTHTVTIFDADPAAKVNFEVANYVGGASEAAAGALTVNVELDSPSERQVVVNYSITGVSTSSAVCGAGHDISTTGTVTIPPNSAMPFALTSLTLCDDLVYEGDEVAVLTLTSATNAILGNALTHSIPITDDELPPDLSIAVVATNYNENAGSAGYTITVNPTAKAFTLNYTTTGTSSVGLDHNLPATGIINVPASTVVQNIPLAFQITDDVNPEDDETVIVTISAGATDATIVTPSATLTINANDPLQLAVGRRHTCGVLEGRVKCWGFGPALGSGTVADYGDDPGEVVSALQAVDLGTGFVPVKVIAGNDFSCSLSSAGTVKCWGLNTLGQLGQDRPGIATTSSEYIGDEVGEMGSSLPLTSLGGVVTDIQTSADASHVCALFTSSRMKCWGDNSSGQLGIAFTAGVCSDTTPNTTCQGDDFGDVTSLNFLTFPSLPGVTVRRISVGDNHTCAQLSNDTVYCWGDNTNGALGVDSGDAARFLDTAPFASAVLFNAAFTVSEITSLSAGLNKTCASFDTGGIHEAVCWGTGANGALGQGNTNDAGTVANPLASVALSIDFAPFTALTSGIKVGGTHACLRADDVVAQVYCWGSNADDQLGSGGGGSNSAPTASVALGPFTDIYAGTDNTCAVSGAFQYVCWGNNASGSAGAQSAANITAPGAALSFQ